MRDFQPVIDVETGLVQGQRPEVVAHRDALSQLTQSSSVELVTQLWLTDQHDLQQLLLVRFQVGEQSHLFEQLVAEILGFVDHQHNVVALCYLLE